MSSEKLGENPSHRKPKGSWARFVLPGLADPKARPKGVADGERVNIPAPLYWSDGGTQYAKREFD